MELKELQQIMRVLKETNLRELEYEKDELKLYVKRENTVSIKNNNTKEITTKKELKNPELELTEIKSYNIGKFYYLNKNGENLITVGKEVKNGENLGYIESIGIKTEILSTVNGKIVEILVENGNIADYGKVLVKIQKD